MSLHAPVYQPSNQDNSSLRISILASRFNEALVGGMLDRTVAELKNCGLKEDQLAISRVPGSAELAIASKWCAESGRFDVIIALGVLIAGETQHHDIISRTVSLGLQDVSLSCGLPVVNGVICAETLDQAKSRTIGEINRGVEFAHAAIEMAHWRQ